MTCSVRFAKIQVEASLRAADVLGVAIKEVFLLVMSLANDVIAFALFSFAKFLTIKLVASWKHAQYEQQPYSLSKENAYLFNIVYRTLWF